MADLKRELRRSVKAALAALSAGERNEKSARAVARLLALSEYERSRTVMAFDAFGTELDTSALLAACLKDGKVLALPCTCLDNCGISVRRVQNLDQDLVRCAFGFREPTRSLPEVPIDQIDLLVVPGLAYDENGNRLGRGKGYYDRFLASPGLRAILCALAFECQVVPRVPALLHDRRVQLVVTEDRMLRAAPLSP
jgi:5-formyltetrahydrofolate cyclo-ligase